MIIVKLKGGLGNQMFQYAHARNLALDEKTDLLLDVSSYAENQILLDTTRKYLLGNFNISEKFATKEELQKIEHTLPVYKKNLPQIEDFILSKVQKYGV